MTALVGGLLAAAALMALAGRGDHEPDLGRDQQHLTGTLARPAATAPPPPSSRGLGRHPFKVEIAGSNPAGGTSDPPHGPPAILAAVEIMGVSIRTIVSDTVAIRCDGCREVIDGTPWRVNLLDIVSPEVAVGWTESVADQPGPPPVPLGRRVRPTLDGGARLPVLPPRRGARDHAPGRAADRPAVVRAVRRAAHATTTSSCPPRRVPRLAARQLLHSPPPALPPDPDLPRFP